METLVTPSLEFAHLPLSDGQKSNLKVIASDVDFTLVNFNTGHQTGIAALSKLYGPNFASETDRIFNLVLESHRKRADEPWEGRPEFEYVLTRTREIQNPDDTQYGLKVWSREFWLKIVSDKLGLNLDNRQIKEGRDQYWQNLTQGLSIYVDAQSFLQTVHQNRIPLILMTGSDSVLNLSDTSMRYDPKFSESYKMTRLATLPIRATSVIVGDPIDKPDPRFFDRVYAEIDKLGTFTKEQVLFVGDSYRGDLEVPQSNGYSTLLIKRS